MPVTAWMLMEQNRGREISPRLVAVKVETEFDHFLREVEHRALRIACFRLRNPEDALDAVQDAMLRLARSYGNRPSEEWPRLFQRILENRICDGLRRRRTRLRFTGNLTSAGGKGGDCEDPFAAVPAPGASNPEKTVAAAASLEALAAAVSRLPRRQREVFTLRVLESLDVGQTSRLMGCSAGSVKTHLHRALKALRVVLEPHYE